MGWLKYNEIGFIFLSTSKKDLALKIAETVNRRIFKQINVYQ